MTSWILIAKALRLSTHYVRTVCMQAVGEASDGGANQVYWGNLWTAYDDTVQRRYILRRVVNVAINPDALVLQTGMSCSKPAATLSKDFD